MTDRPILFSAPMIQAILREIEVPGTGALAALAALASREAPPATAECSRCGSHGDFGCYECTPPACHQEAVTVAEAIKKGAAMIVKKGEYHYQVGNNGYSRFEDALESAALRALKGSDANV